MSFSFTGKLKTLPQIAYLDLKDHFAGGEKRGKREKKEKEGKGWKGWEPPPEINFWLRLWLMLCFEYTRSYRYVRTPTLFLCKMLTSKTADERSDESGLFTWMQFGRLVL